MKSSMITVRRDTIQATTEASGLAAAIFLPSSPDNRAARGSRKSGSRRFVSISRKAAIMKAVSDTSFISDSTMRCFLLNIPCHIGIILVSVRRIRVRRTLTKIKILVPQDMPPKYLPE